MHVKALGKQWGVFTTCACTCYNVLLITLVSEITSSVLQLFLLRGSTLAETTHSSQAP